MKGYRIHPACEVLPPLPPKAFADLQASIKAIGLVQPILTAADGSILDGKNRLMACERAGVTPRFEPADLNGLDPVAWVLEVNRHRLRTTSQLALAAAKLVTATDTPKKYRENKEGSANCGTFTRDDIAKAFKVSKAAIDRAGYVLEHGVPELVAYVDYGEVTVGAAFDVAHAPAERQLDAAAIDAKAVRKFAGELRKAKQPYVGDEAIEPTLAKLRRIADGLPVDERRRALQVAAQQMQDDLARLEAEIGATPKKKRAVA